jgi:hypothetical protein
LAFVFALAFAVLSVIPEGNLLLPYPCLKPAILSIAKDLLLAAAARTVANPPNKSGV